MTDISEERSLKRVLIEVARDREDREPEFDKDGKPIVSVYFGPSAMGQCERRVILSHAGVQGKPMTDEDAMFFWLGDIIHDAVQKGIAEKLGGQVWNEVHLRDETYKVSGRLDSLRLMKKDGDWIVYEYKSQRTDAFRFKMPKPDHILQVLIYCTFPISCPECTIESPKGSHNWIRNEVKQCPLCSNTGYVGPAKMGKLCYIGKEDGRLEVFDITPDDETKGAVKQKLMRLQELASQYEMTGTLPDALPKEPILDKKTHEPEVYQKSSTKFGFKKGDPKLKDDYRVQNCPYLGSGKCCGDKSDGI